MTSDYFQVVFLALYFKEYNVMDKGDETGQLPGKRLCFWDYFWVALWLVPPTSVFGQAQTTTVQVTPDADSFVRSLASSSNYGAAGALSVSGSSATNSMGVQNGLFDTLMRFSLTNALAYLDTAFGGQDWVITRVRLLVNEMGTPDNASFNRGVGAFEIRWMAADQWIEGTGTPKIPTNDGLAWDDLSTLVHSNLDVSLGVFTNSGLDGPIAFTLALADPFISDIRLGGPVSLHWIAASDQVGFTFNSRDFGNTNAQPVLELSAAVPPRPIIDSIVRAGENVLVSFEVSSNWNYRLQRASSLHVESNANWSDVWTIAAQPSLTNVSYTDVATNQRMFYRLSISP